MITRRFVLTLVLALLAGAAFALPATGGAPRVEHWGGVWDTQHKFGSPRLFLHQDGDQVSGTYKDNGGALRGTISGTLSGRKYRFWSGRFHDTKGGSSKGKFSVELKSDNESFEGTFKTCGRIRCGDAIAWTGEHR